MKKKMKKNIESQIKAIKKLSMIDQKINKMFKDEYLEKNMDVFAVAWDLAESVISTLVNEDYQVFYDGLGERQKNGRGLGWVDGEGFIPDQMMSVLVHSDLSAKETIKELNRLYSLILEA